MSDNAEQFETTPEVGLKIWMLLVGQKCLNERTRNWVGSRGSVAIEETAKAVSILAECIEGSNAPRHTITGQSQFSDNSGGLGYCIQLGWSGTWSPGRYVLVSFETEETQWEMTTKSASKCVITFDTGIEENEKSFFLSGIFQNAGATKEDLSNVDSVYKTEEEREKAYAEWRGPEVEKFVGVRSPAIED